MSSTDKLVITALEGANPEQHVYALQGPLTIGNLLIAQEVLKSPAQVLILDLGAVPFIDSAGIGALVNCFVSRQKNGRRLLLAAPSDMVQKLFKVTRVNQLFETFPTLDAARQ